MEQKCVIDSLGNYVTNVLFDGQNILYYTLKDGESLISARPPIQRPCAGAHGLISPMWGESAWEEKATNEEIAAWEAEHPAPEIPVQGKTLEEVAEYLNETAKAVMLLSVD